MKTKEQVIQEAYEVLNIPFNENILYDNGWTKIKPGQFYSKYDDLDLLKLTTHVHSIRPKHLRGIENNNGWIKIESADDLPKEYGAYYVKYLNGQSVAWFNGTDFMTLVGKKFTKITHFQPIKTPNPPLY